MKQQNNKNAPQQQRPNNNNQHTDEQNRSYKRRTKNEANAEYEYNMLYRVIV